MQEFDVLWVIIFFSSLTITNFTLHNAKCYIRDKPPGMKSLHDIVFKDMICVVQFAASTICMTSILSRFEIVREVLSENPFLLTVFCSIYICGFTSVCISNSCICIIRILCIIDLTFVEEHLGEPMTRACALLIPFLACTSACIICSIHNDINSGTAMTLFTGRSVATGIKTTIFVSFTSF